MTNPAGYALTYNGLVIAAEKRRSHGWQAFGSYTFSKAAGLQVSSGASAAGSQVSTIAGAPGRLPNDRPHMLRVMGSVDLPRTGMVLAANVQHFTGKPWAATAQIALTDGVCGSAARDGGGETESGQVSRPRHLAGFEDEPHFDNVESRRARTQG